MRQKTGTLRGLWRKDAPKPESPEGPAAATARPGSKASSWLASVSPHQAVISGILTLWILCLGFNIHGFSISEWRNYLDESPQTEVLLNKANPFRSDDFFASLPIFFSQISSPEPFALNNKIIGDGLNVSLFSFALYKSPSVIFRPWTWGALGGMDFGMSWIWCTRVFGLILAGYLLFHLLTDGLVALPLAAAVTWVFSPFVQYWGLNNIDPQLWVTVCLIGGFLLVRAETTKTKMMAAVLLGWAGGCFLHTMYPPYQVSLAYAFLGLFGGLVFASAKKSWRNLMPILGGLGLACLILGLAGYWFYQDVAPILDDVANSVYPGTRFFAGGNFWVLKRTFASVLIQGTRHDFSRWNYTGNICEAAGFLLLFPAVLAGQLLLSVFRRKSPPPEFLGVLAVMGLLLSYCYFGFSDSIARWTLLSMVPESRAAIGIGVMDLCLFVLFLRQWYGERDQLAPWQRRLIYGVSLVLLVAFYAHLRLMVKEANAPWGGINKAYAYRAIGAISLALLLSFRWRWGAGLFAALSIAATGWFNPIVRGGADYLLQNDLSRKIRELAATMDKDARWIAYDTMAISNLFRILGLPSLGGVVWPPQPEFWARHFDPDRQNTNFYNRYAHVVFQYWPSMNPGWVNPALDNVTVLIHPDSPILTDLKVSGIVVSGDPGPFQQLKNFEKVFEYKKHHVFIRKK